MIPAARCRPGFKRSPWAALLLASGIGLAACNAPPHGEHAAGTMSDDAWSLERRLGDERVMLSGRIDTEAFGLDPVVVTAGPSDPDPSALESAAPYRLRGFDDAGAELFAMRFGAAALVAVSPGPARRFMFVAEVPGGAAQLARVELTAADGRQWAREARLSRAGLEAALERGEGLSVEGRPGDAVGIRWDPGRFVLLHVHDAKTGLALGAGRAGELVVSTEAMALDIAVSDGVRSGAVRMRAR
ncbi:hypothetical protein [Wenzhouxiangella sp. XN24]|uniref:hypothetical protein n=1 Tax=Wenzhouxiangella sp. XN24 TaxID=2713569 RepID=UPI0013EA1AD3|nr:hypothetical protein [Wenzhouxiangella sp. XN24]NGX14858.1 hypothetical protein [Wenzhouxiangella sp. XN24]